MSKKFIIVPLAAALMAAAPALAQQVGTATAVNPVSESTPPGGATDKLTVGARVMHNERIQTSPSESAQLLFLDKSSLSIAGNTNLVIDEFVYDPAANRGHMLTRLTEGSPKGTPRPILNKLSDALDKALDDQKVRSRFSALGGYVPDKARRGQQALATLVKDEIARWAPIIKTANINR
jgi:Tripartite tricarboxylate transporter family receptor